MSKSVTLILALAVLAGAASAGAAGQPAPVGKAKTEATALAPAEARLEQGKQVFQQWCAACHAAGRNYPGTLALQAKYKGEIPAALEERTDLSPELVQYFVRHGISVMPFFRKTEISDSDLAALGAYLKAPKTTVAP